MKAAVQQRDELLQQLEALKAEKETMRQQLAAAQQQLASASSGIGDASIRHTAVFRSHVSLTSSQKPDSDALVRLAQTHDASISELRRGQLDVIHTLLGNKDCAAFMPTGGGKSLIWLLHNLLSTERVSGIRQNSLTVVVVPFTATPMLPKRSHGALC